MEEDFELSLFKLQKRFVQIGLTILLSEPIFHGCKAESLEHFQKLDLLDCVVEGIQPALFPSSLMKSRIPLFHNELIVRKHAII